MAKNSNIISGVVDLGGEIWPKVRDGGFPRFWKDCWVGEIPLCHQFPRLFLVSNQQEAMVKDMWSEEERGVGAKL